MGHGTSSGRTRESIADANTMREAINRVERIFDETRDQGPEATANRLVEELGEEAANRAVATLVNRAEGDGRISGQNADWARNVNGALSRDQALNRGVGSDRIHRTHVDQLASAMRRRS